MAWRPSIALRNYMLEGGSFKSAMSNANIKLYTGAQPATAEAAPTGTLLCTFTKSSGALTREVLPVGSFTISGGSGSIDTVTLSFGGGTGINILPAAVSYTTNINTTATAVATAINNNPINIFVTASTTGASGVITFTGKRGVGASLNGTVPGGTATTLSIGTVVNIGTGTAGVTAVNALTWGDAATNAIVKNPAETWSGVAAASGTAGWFRVEAGTTDAGALDSSEAVLRVDGSVATSGAEWNMASTSIVSGATQTISSFSITFPTA